MLYGACENNQEGLVWHILQGSWMSLHLNAWRYFAYFISFLFVVVCWNLTCLQEVTQVFWGEGSPENSEGNSLDCAYLALQEDNLLLWKDMACGWVKDMCVEYLTVFAAITMRMALKLPPSVKEAIFSQMDQLQPFCQPPPQPKN